MDLEALKKLLNKSIRDLKIPYREIERVEGSQLFLSNRVNWELPLNPAPKGVRVEFNFGIDPEEGIVPISVGLPGGVTGDPGLLRMQTPIKHHGKLGWIWVEGEVINPLPGFSIWGSEPITGHFHPYSKALNVFVGELSDEDIQAINITKKGEEEYTILLYQNSDMSLSYKIFRVVLANDLDFAGTATRDDVVIEEL